MSRTDLDATTIANSLRMRAGDGSMEWVAEPIQASVLLDIADMLDEYAKLRKLVAKQAKILGVGTGWCYADCVREFECEMDECRIESAMRELGIEVEE